MTNEVVGHVCAGRFVSADGDVTVGGAGRDGPSVLLVRPEALRLLPAGTPEAVAAVAVDARFAGTYVAIVVQRAGGKRLTIHAPLGVPVELGCAVSVGIPAEAATVLAV